MTGRKTDKNNGHNRRLTWVEIEGKYRKLSCGKNAFQFQKREKSDGPNLTSKVLTELFIRLYEQFKLFLHSLNLTFDKNT